MGYYKDNRVGPEDPARVCECDDGGNGRFSLGAAAAAAAAAAEGVQPASHEG